MTSNKRKSNAELSNAKTSNAKTRKNRHPILVIGYGNPGREDDGLGPAFVKAFRDSAYKITLTDPYQLTVEDALSFKDDMIVVFVDAAKHLSEPFVFSQAQPSTEHGLGSHALSPEALLQLSDTVLDVRPQAFIMAIRGYQFDAFDEQLSAAATHNLNQAIDYFNQWLSDNATLKNSEQNQTETPHA